MKKITKSLALAGALICSSVGLVACGGGEQPLVNVQGNYVAASETSVNTETYVNSLDNLDTVEASVYKFRLKFQGSGESEGVKLNANLNITGHIAPTTNDMDYAMSLNVKASMRGFGYSINTTQNMYYSSGDTNIYMDINGKGLGEYNGNYYIPVKIGTDAEMDLPCGDDYVSGVGIHELIDNLALAEQDGVTVSQDNTGTKIKYLGADGQIFYIVFDSEDNFVGMRAEFSMEYEGFKGNTIMEVIPTTEKVRKLTDAQKAKYTKEYV